MANKGDEITTKFRVDISDLKKNITEANQNIKLANAEFKAASAGMDNWAKSGEGIRAKLGQLNTVLTEQNKKLESYKKQQEELDSAYKENGRRADELKSKMAELAEKGVSKTSEEYKKYQKALSEVEKEQAENKKASDDLRVTILNQQAAINKTEKDIKNYESSLNELESGTDKAETATDKLTKEISEQRNELDKLKDKYSDVVLQQGKSSDEAQELAREIKDLSGELKENQNKLSDAEKSADEFDETLSEVGETAEKSSGGFEVLTEKISNFVTNGIKLAIDSVKNFITESINVGKEFDSAMSQVEAVSGASGEEIEALRDKAKEMGESTKFSASEVAEAFNYMAMAGWKTDKMLNGIEGILNLSAASGEELATTSDIVTDAMTALGMSADESAHFADVLAAASSNANTNVSLLGESFKYVAPVAGAMSSSAEDLSIALGLMANSGIKGSQAGNSLKNALVNLTKPTEAQAEAMANLGFISTETINKIDFTEIEKAEKDVQNATYNLDSAQIKLNSAIEKYGEDSSQAQLASINYEKAQNKLADAQEKLASEQAGVFEQMRGTNILMTDSDGKMKSLGEIMDTLRQKMGKVSVELTDSEGNAREYDDIMADLTTTTEELAQAEQLQSAATIFGKQNLAGMLAIINASDEDYQKLTESIYGCDGAAKDMADTMQDNLEGDLTKLKSKFEGVQIAVSEKLTPALRGGVEIISQLIDAAKNAAKFIAKHSTEIIAAIAAVGTAIAGLALIGVIQNISKISTALVTWASSTKIVTAAQWLLNAAMSANPISLIVIAIAALVAAFVVLWNKSEGFRNFWIGLWENIKTAVQPVIDFIVNLFSGLWENVKIVAGYIGEFFSGLWNGIVESVKPILDSVVNAFKEAWELIKAVWDFVTPFFEQTWAGIKNIFDIVAPFFELAFQNAWKCIQIIWEAVVPYFKAVWNQIKAVFSVVKTYLGGMFKTAWEAIKAVWNGVAGYFKATWDTIAGIFSVVKNVLAGNWEDAWESIKGIVGTWKAYFEGIWDSIKKVFGSVKSWFKDTFDSAWEAVKSVFSGWGEFFGGLWTNIKDKFSSIGTDISDAVSESVRAGINGVIWAIESIINNGIDLINNAISLINTIPGVDIGYLDGLELPRLATGGVLKKGQVGLLEGSGAEAVVPLEKNKYWIKKVADELRGQLSGINAGISGTTVNNSPVTNSNVNNFTQVINAPKTPSRIEIYRQTKNLLALSRRWN
ncbi:MAG: phage tail tape measure protein [Ruminococcus sp.]|nr:phage tail tape measure protein [Ruminococcus sp.]